VAGPLIKVLINYTSDPQLDFLSSDRVMHIRQAEVSEAIAIHSNVHLEKLSGADCSWSLQPYTMDIVQTCLYCPLRYLTSLVLFCVRAIGRESTKYEN
jgi:hypothetical protein